MLNDYIRRSDVLKLFDEWGGGFAYIEVETDGAIEAVNALPSAQTEQLTDTEQRIFLSAMGRERKVCKQDDEEWRDCREPYEDSLVSVCNEIERKVKGALWKI